MVPFHIRYELTRGPRLAAYLHVWGPCLAPCLGFTLGIAFLSAVVSAWFLPLLIVPVALGRWYLPGLLDIVRHRTEPVEITTDTDELVIASRRGRQRLALQGIIQVFRAGDSWTVLHAGGAVLRIPAGAISEEQVAYLKGFAWRAGCRRG